jgi:hypothetical protein
VSLEDQRRFVDLADRIAAMLTGLISRWSVKTTPRG